MNTDKKQLENIEDIEFKFLFNEKSEEPNWSYDICDLEKDTLKYVSDDMIKFTVKSKNNHEIWDMKIKLIDGDLYILSEYIDEDNIEFNKLNSFVSNDEVIYHNTFKYGEVYLHIEYN